MEVWWVQCIHCEDGSRATTVVAVIGNDFLKYEGLTGVRSIHPYLSGTAASQQDMVEHEFDTMMLAFFKEQQIRKR